MLIGPAPLSQHHLTGMDPDISSRIITEHKAKYKLTSTIFADLWGPLQKRPGPPAQAAVSTIQSLLLHFHNCWKEYDLPERPSVPALRAGLFANPAHVRTSVYFFANIGGRLTSCKFAERKTKHRSSIVETVADITRERIPGWPYPGQRNWSAVGRVLFYIQTSIQLPQWDRAYTVDTARIVIFPWARNDANTDYVREYNAYDVVDCSGQKVGYAGVPFLPVSLLYRQCLLFPCLQRHTANKSFFFLQPLDHVNDMDDNNQQ